MPPSFIPGTRLNMFQSVKEACIKHTLLSCNFAGTRSKDIIRDHRAEHVATSDGVVC